MRWVLFLWYFQRVSALVVLSYVLTILFFLYFFSIFSSYELWRNFITTPEIKFYTTIFLLISFSHGVQGLKAVEDDYLSERTLGFFICRNCETFSSGKIVL
ncbi:MAG: succinate dehydrogenase, hydrophobic membrane anchor protein [Gammaproteobacteria bacterium]